MTTPEPTNTPRSRFRPRLSLRALMLLVLVAGGGTGWWKAARDREERHRQVYSALRSAGLESAFDDPLIGQFPEPDASQNVPVIPPARLSADQIGALNQYPRLHQWTMTQTEVTDELVAIIARSPKLEQIHGSCPELSDGGLKPLTQLDHLRSLQLVRATRLTDACLVHVGQVSPLRFLTISEANLRGPGVNFLANLSSLQSLAIPNTGVNDTGIAAIGRLARLETLDVGGGAYTDAGLARLAPLARLTTLAIGSPHITAGGLDGLRGLKRLKALTLSGAIDDAWLDHLAERGPVSLRTVDLNGAVDVGDEAIGRLHRARPKIRLRINTQPR